LINWVTAVQKNAFFAVDKGNAAFAAACDAVTWIVGKVAQIFIEVF